VEKENPLSVFHLLATAATMLRKHLPQRRALAEEVKKAKFALGPA
jgi:hypothetical protein